MKTLKLSHIITIGSLFLLSTFANAQFNDRLSVQGYLKSRATALNDPTGYPMQFVIKRNTTVIWCQSAASPVPVVTGIFSSVLSGNSNCQSLTNAMNSALFSHSANSDTFAVDVRVDMNKDGFGGGDDAVFAGIDLIPASFAIASNQAETAKNVSGTVAIANGGTGASTAAGARTNLGLGNLAILNSNGVATDVLLGTGAFGPAPTPVNFSDSLSGDVTGTQSAMVVGKTQGRPVSAGAPANGQVLTWNSTQARWEPQTPIVSGGVTSVAGRAGDVILTSADISDASHLSSPNTLVRRDANNSFSAGTVTASVVNSQADLNIESLSSAGNISIVPGSGSGEFRIGSTGTGFSAMGACTTPTITISTTAINVNCTGLPASTSVAVYCSGSNVFQAAGTTALYCRASDTADQVRCNTTVSNNRSMTYTCMWMMP